jgi:5'-nucleotidase
MRILVVNDDGIGALGIQKLARKLSENHEVTVVAPESERSATAHCITLRRPLRISNAEPSGMEGIPCYIVDGMPVDCTKVGLTHIMKSGTDLVVSGVNHGSNMGSDVIYSGTVSAALDAVIMGFKAMAVSIDSYSPENIGSAVEIAAGLINGGLFDDGYDGILYNLNVPDLPLEDIKGVKAALQGKTVYRDTVEIRRDPRDNEYIWLSGILEENCDIEGTDVYLVKQGYAALTPLKFDLTANERMHELESKIKNMRLSFKQI